MKIITQSLIVTLCLSSTLLATEAYNPIAYGVKARGMSGTGVAYLHGAESSLINPALVAYTKKSEVALGFTYMQGGADYKTDSSSLDFDMESTLLPFVVMNQKIGENYNIGFSLTTLSSLNGSISTSPTNNVVISDISKTRISIPFAYTIANFSVGLSGIMERQGFTIVNMPSSPNTGYGFDLGLAYNLDAIGLSVGLDYKSKINHTMKNFDNTSGEITDMEVNTASEIALGIAWEILDSGHAIAFDYKALKGSEIFKIEGAADIELEDINIFAVGYEYKSDNWSARTGYRYVSNLYDIDRAQEITVYVPYNLESHFSIGGSYKLSSTLSADAAMTYAISNKTYTDSGSFDIDLTQASLALGLTYHY